MPLIIVVLIIIVVVLNTQGSLKETNRKRREYTNSIRRTNAELELKLINQHIQSGSSLEQAFNLAHSDLARLNFEPCIPQSALSLYEGYAVVYHRYYNVAKFDSDAVRNLREDFKREAKKSDKKFATREEFDQACEAYVYSNLPQTTFEYEQYLRRSIKKLDAVAVGQYISYPGLGTCEVIALDFNTMQHTVRAVSTGKIVKIAIGDKRIIKL